MRRRELDEQRQQHRRRAVVAHAVQLPVVVGVVAVRLPEDTVDRERPALRTRRERGRAGGLALHGAALGDGLLEFVQQAVQVDRDDRGRADGRQRRAVAEPARAEVPAALGGGAQVAPHLGVRAARGLARRRDVLQPRFRARRVLRVPVAIQHGAVGQHDDMAAGLARRRGLGAAHPVRVLLAQGRQVAPVGCVALHLRRKRHHQREERWLRAAEVVRPVAVRHVAVGLDLIGEVLEHVVDQALVPRFLQAQHREVAVPVVALAEAPARHDVGPRQGQQRAVGRRSGRGARQHGPQPVDVLAQAGCRQRSGRCICRCGEIPRDEGGQREARLILAGLVSPDDGRRVAVRDCVDERLLVGVDLGRLHRDEQRTVELVWRRRRRGRRAQGACRCRQQRDDEQHQLEPHPVPDGTDQNCPFRVFHDCGG